MIKIKEKTFWGVIGILVFIIALFLALALVKLPVVVKESYWDQESYQSLTWESYVVSAKRCDVVLNCWCIHHNFWGTCDSCQCQRQVEVTKWRYVEKERDRTIYCTVLEKFRGKCELGNEVYGIAKIN